MKSSNSGFTLIELLVVIAIIGILASIAWISFNSTIRSARDSRRITEIENLSNALEMCYGDFGNYPDGDKFPTFWFGSISTPECKAVNSCKVCWNNFMTHIKPCVKRGDISDPINKDPNAYYYFNFGKNCLFYDGKPVNEMCRGHYVIMAVLETPENENETAGCFEDPSRYLYWKVLGL